MAQHEALTIAPYEPALREPWEALVERSPQAWLYHKREFIDIVTRSLSQRECSLVARKQDRVVAILPLHYYLHENPPKMVSIAMGPAGPALDPTLGQREAHSVTEALFDRAAAASREHRCKALQVALPPIAPEQLANAHGVSPLDPFGFAPISTSTYTIDLSPTEEQLLANLRPAARQAIRKCEKEGIAIREASPSDLDAFYTLHQETYDRTGAGTFPRAYFEGFFSILGAAGLARIWTAELHDQPQAFLVALHFKNCALYSAGCSRADALESGANYALQWHAIRAFKTLGATHYNIGEAFPGHRGDKLAGLDTFKSAFGGERWPYHKGRIDLAPAARPSRLRLSLYYLKQTAKSLLGKA